MSAVTMMNEDEIQRTESVSTEAGFGCITTSLGNLPVKGLDLKTRISGLVYEATVRQTYVNRHAQPLEATYIFPLPDRGAVGEFKMFVGRRQIEGVLKERGAARREYQQAIDSGHRASIVEEERPDTFTMRVGNVEPGEEITIEFTVTGPLVFADGEATFRFPLVVAPRYIPGSPLEGGNVGDGTATDTNAVPDASRISPPVLLPGFPSPISLSIDCELHDAGLAVRNVRSSLHAVTMSQGNGVHHLAIRPGERVNRDFIVRFDVAEDAVKTGATFTRDADDAGGTFMVTLVPPTEAKGDALPRDLVFVLDRSGSMDGWKMVAARRAIGRMLDTMTPKDRFQVIVFDNESTAFGTDLVEGSNRNRYRAIEDLSKIEARGGTEMAQPIFDGLAMLAGGYQDRRRMLVLVTDGQVGNEEQIVAGVQQRQKNVSIFTVGIDQAVNAGFLNRLADVGGGRCELVESEDRLDAAMDRIHRTIDTPVLTELNVSLDGVIALSNMFVPERMPDLFAGAPVQVFGRFRGTGTPVVHITASERDGSKFSATVKARETSDAATSAIWARQKVRALEDQYAKSSSPALSSEITQLSLKFGVLCRFTSWVAVDRDQKIEAAGDLRQVVQAVEQPAGWAAGGSPPPQAQYAAAPMPASPAAPGISRARAVSAAMPADSFSRSVDMELSGGPGGTAKGGSFDRMEFALEEADDTDEYSVQEGGDRSDLLVAQYESLAAPEPERKKAEKARRVTRSTPSMTQAGVLNLNAAYLSPEQARGEDIDERTDVFLLGILAFQMLTGRKLFSAINDFEVLQSILSWNPSILAKEPTITGHWLEILSKALQPKPADRYGDPRELLEDLKARFGDFTTASMAWPHPNDITLNQLIAAGPMQVTDALWVFGWLVAAVAHMEEATGQPVGSLMPWSINVQGGTGRAHVAGHNGPDFFDKVKRWLGLEETSRRDQFWK